MVSVCVPVCTFFIPSTLGVVLFTVALGFLLSLDFSQVGVLLRACRMDGQSADLSARLPSSLGWGLGWREVLVHFVLLLGALTEAGLLHYFLPSPQDWSVGPQAVAGYLSLILFVINWTLQEVQGVYLLGGVFHNPLYPKETTNVKVFKVQNKCLRMAGMVRRVLVSLGEALAIIYSSFSIQFLQFTFLILPNCHHTSSKHSAILIGSCLWGVGREQKCEPPWGP